MDGWMGVWRPQSGVGPNVPMGQDLIHVNPPKLEDYSSDEGRWVREGAGRQAGETGEAAS